MSYSEFIKDNPKLLELNPINFPQDIFISTITLTCKIPVIFDTMLIASKIQLNLDFIQYVSYGNNGEICRTLININKRKHRKTKTKKKNFYNQVTMIIKVNDNDRISVKLFKNGSIQITGCKLISSIIWSLDKLFKILVCPIIDENTKKIYFVTPYIFLDIKNIYDFKIALINSNFDIGFKINREHLYECLHNDKYDCTFDSARYAGVIIKYVNSINDIQKKVIVDKKSKYNKKQVTSIFVFDKGSIIITGSRCYRNTIESYKFINTYLINNYEKICIT